MLILSYLFSSLFLGTLLSQLLLIQIPTVLVLQISMVLAWLKQLNRMDFLTLAYSGGQIEAISLRKFLGGFLSLRGWEVCPAARPIDG